MKTVVCSIGLLALAACNNSAEQESSTRDSAVNTSVEAAPRPSTDDSKGLTGCYRMVTGRDTVNLKLDQQGKEVTGALEFDNYEKDSSHGSVKGSVDGDKVTVWYNFNSEGMKSVSQMILQKKGDDLVMGTGEIRTSQDTAYLANPENLKFDESQKLVKIACD